MMYYSEMAQANSEKEIPSAPYQESNLRPSDYYCSSDALPLSSVLRRLGVGAKAIVCWRRVKAQNLSTRIS